MSGPITVCPVPEATNYSRNSVYLHNLTWYYDYTALAMRFAVSTISDGAIQRVAKAINNPKETSILIMEDIVRNGYILAIVVVSVVFSFMLLVSLIVACTSHFHSGGKRMPSNNSICCAMLSFTFCLIMATSGGIIFGSSTFLVISGIKLLPTQVNRSSEDIGEFVFAFGENLHCNFNNEEQMLRVQTKQMVESMHKLSDSIRTELDTSMIATAIAQEESLQKRLLGVENLMKSNRKSKVVDELRSEVQAIRTLLNSQLQQLKPEVEDTGKRIDELRNDIKESVAQTDEHQKAIVSELTVYKKMFNDIVTKVEAEAKLFRRAVYNVMKENDYTNKASFYMLFILLLPLTLILLCLIGLTFLVARYIANCCSATYDEYPMRGFPSRVGATLLGCGGYVAMLISVLLFAMVAICFILAFTSMFLCVSLFEDEDLRVLYALPKMEFKGSIATRNITLTLHDTFYKCKNGFTFFDAIDGDQIWAQKELEKKLSALRKTSYRRKIRNFYISDKLQENIEAFVQQLKSRLNKLQEAIKRLRNAGGYDLPSGFNRAKVQSECDQMLRECQEFTSSVEKLSQMLILVTSRSRRDTIAKKIHSLMVDLENAIVRRVANLLRTINDLSPQCEALMSIWNDFGYYMCNVVAVPAQGLWVACLVTAIGSLAIYSALFEATTFLANYADYSEDAVSSLKIQLNLCSQFLLTPGGRMHH
ncbi:hypothetical protein Y032_0103g3542 [Ancylostoma ceylanicum]|uniref:Prominin n=1 Tax=Ancylostoma ceylanicum TaxID=53326 RepID=A0A016TH39_9BILA|nr:hypothetical protein Y032_0103g3542 [Ancylostoma ceylanicum]